MSKLNEMTDEELALAYVGGDIRDTDPIRERYTKALNWLRDVADGKAGIPGLPPAGTETRRTFFPMRTNFSEFQDSNQQRTKINRKSAKLCPSPDSLFRLKAHVRIRIALLRQWFFSSPAFGPLLYIESAEPPSS